MTTYVVVYRGRTVAESRLVALSADPTLVADVISRILAEKQSEDTDPIITRLDQGRREALQLIRQEASDGRD
jgi:hypothetical protein